TMVPDAFFQLCQTFSDIERVVPAPRNNSALALSNNFIHFINGDDDVPFLVMPGIGHKLINEDQFNPQFIHFLYQGGDTPGPQIGHDFPTVLMGQVGSWLAWPLFFIGMFINPIIAWVGVLLFGAVVVFQMVTLPVEFNASKRAVEQIQQVGIVNPNEAVAAKRVLNAAAMTYVAATIQAFLTLLYFLMRMGLLGGRDE
ncbi:zinc metallopeptidase, partial [bacterium]|nr:zinc metallopeptidase [bacterium]